MNFSNIKTTILVSIILLFTQLSNAQCAMCRAVLETEESGVKAESINDGIVYLMAFPYILLVVIGWAIYKIMKKKKMTI
ncbi:hypothetical protein [Flavobacterium sp. I3-2]|uniref:hypothetical protein n=1 Tax=Flavobacterium sp. I3-2 TaxID=2748319 RepID=UPI0015B03D1F|nr:hypothetical protein [Flavobacterium sp. I3-2]